MWGYRLSQVNILPFCTTLHTNISPFHYRGDLHNIVLGDYDLYSDEGYEQEMLVDAIFLRNKFKLTEEMVGDIALIKLR